MTEAAGVVCGVVVFVNVVALPFIGLWWNEAGVRAATPIAGGRYDLANGLTVEVLRLPRGLYVQYTDGRRTYTVTLRQWAAYKAGQLYVSGAP